MSYSDAGFVRVWTRQIGYHQNRDNPQDYHEWIWSGESMRCDSDGRAATPGRGTPTTWAVMTCNGPRCPAVLRVCLEGVNGLGDQMLSNGGMP
jgi:hypothetical protein